MRKQESQRSWIAGWRIRECLFLLIIASFPLPTLTAIFQRPGGISLGCLPFFSARDSVWVLCITRCVILKQSLSLLQTFRWDYRSHCGHGCRNPQSDPGLCPSSNSSSLSLLPWGIFNGEEPGPCRLSGCDVPPKVSAGSPGCQFALFRILQGFCLLGLLILIFWEHPSSNLLGTFSIPWLSPPECFLTELLAWVVSSMKTNVLGKKSPRF